MLRLVTIALRNARRNRWRSAVSLLAVLVGVCAMVFLQGFIQGFIQSLAEDMVHTRIGAIRIHRAGYSEATEDPLRADLPDDPALVEKLRALPRVTAVTRRLQFDGMLSNGAIAAMFVAGAIDPATEYQVCPRRRQRVATGFTPLDTTHPNAVLLSGAFAGALGAEKGSSLVMSSETREHAANALEAQVHGLLADGGEMENKREMVVTLALAQELLRMPGRVTEYVLDIDELDRVDEAAAAVRAALGSGYEILTWRDLPALRDIIDRMGMVMFFIGFILAALVVSGIVNTVLMSVYERVREFGTMMAVGVRRRQVLYLVLIESAALGLAGAALGAGLALALIHHWSGGIHFPQTAASGVLVVIPRVGARFVTGAIALATAGAMLAALYPAWQASRLRPIDRPARQLSTRGQRPRLRLGVKAHEITRAIGRSIGRIRVTGCRRRTSRGRRWSGRSGTGTARCARRRVRWSASPASRPPPGPTRSSPPTGTPPSCPCRRG